MKAICHQLTIAEQQGLLQESFLRYSWKGGGAHNFQTKAACWRRYRQTVKYFCESLLIREGQQLFNFVAMHLEG